MKEPCGDDSHNIAEKPANGVKQRNAPPNLQSSRSGTLGSSPPSPRNTPPPKERHGPTTGSDASHRTHPPNKLNARFAPSQRPFPEEYTARWTSQKPIPVTQLEDETPTHNKHHKQNVQAPQVHNIPRRLCRTSAPRPKVRLFHLCREPRPQPERHPSVTSRHYPPPRGGDHGNGKQAGSLLKCRRPNKISKRKNPLTPRQ